MTVCECVRSVLAVYGWVADVVGSRSGMVGELGTRRCVCMVCVWWGLSGGGVEYCGRWGSSGNL